MSEHWLGFNQYEPRGPFIDFHARPHRWAVIVAHRRAGKTVACVADLVLDALFTKKQDYRAAYIAPQYNQAKDIAWGYIKRLTADVPGVQYNESELRADFPNGARIRLYGADNPDRLRGLYLDAVILDEYADMKPRVWGEIIRPLLADRKGWAAFIGTPKGKNEFWRIWNDADASWFKLNVKASESGLLDSEELKAARASMTEDQYLQEFENSFEAAITGAYYGRELRQLEEAGRHTAVDWDDQAPVYTAWDLGYHDDTAIWFYQVVLGEVRFIDYYAASGLSIEDYAGVVKGKPYKYKLHWLPHDARAKTLASGGKSIQEQLAVHLGMPTLRIVPDLSVQDGIQAVRMMLPRTWFDKTNCGDGVEALKQYQREWDEDKKTFREKPRHDWTSHCADALRMAAIAWREERPKEPQEPPMWAVQAKNGRVTTAPLNELWKTAVQREERY